jgi:hypothetical protein
MIEQGLLTYLLQVPAVSALVGNKIYYRRAPSTVKMPWVIITNSGGMRSKLSMDVSGYSEAVDTLTLYVDTMSQFEGKAIADAVLAAVENYRGDMSPALDTHFRAGSVRDLDGYNGAFRFLLTFYVRYKYDTVTPTPLP